MKSTTYESNPKTIHAAMKTLILAIADEKSRLQGAPSMTVEEAVTAYANSREFHDELDTVRKTLYQVMNAYKESVVPNKMVEHGLKTVSTENHRVTIKQRIAASMLDKDACFAWFRENGLADIITETVNAQTLGKIAEEKVEQNEELPDDLFKTSTAYTTTLTALK